MKPSRSTVCAALLAALFAGPALAVDTTLVFSGPCANATCRGSANGTTPARPASATLTLTDLEWVPLASGGYEALVADAFNFGYDGPGSTQPAGSISVGDRSFIYSNTPSVAGIYKFDLVLGEPVGPAPGVLYLSGDSNGWSWGNFILLPVGSVLLPFRSILESGVVPGLWTVSAVPEPASLTLMSLGLGLGLLGWRRRAGAA